MEQVRQIKKAMKTENKKIKESLINCEVEMLLKTHPDGLTIKEIAKYLHKSGTSMRNFKRYIAKMKLTYLE